MLWQAYSISVNLNRKILSRVIFKTHCIIHFEFSLKLQNIKQGNVSFILKEVLAKHVSALSNYTADYLVYLRGSQLYFYNACIFKNLSFSRSALPQGYLYHPSAFTQQFYEADFYTICFCSCSVFKYKGMVKFWCPFWGEDWGKHLPLDGSHLV